MYAALHANGRQCWIGMVICDHDEQTCPDDSQAGVSGSFSFFQFEATYHRRPRYSDADSDTLNQLYDCAAVAIFIIQEVKSVLGQSSWWNSGSIYCRLMAI